MATKISKTFIIRINQSIQTKAVVEIISFKISEIKSMARNNRIKMDPLRIKIIGIISKDLTTTGSETKMDNRSLHKMRDGTVMANSSKGVVINWGQLLIIITTTGKAIIICSEEVTIKTIRTISRTEVTTVVRTISTKIKVELPRMKLGITIKTSILGLTGNLSKCQKTMRSCGMTVLATCSRLIMPSGLTFNFIS